MARVQGQRSDQVVHSQEGMFVLAQETGGLFLHDTNDLAGALRQAAEDGDGYYLIGYHPDADTFDNRNNQPKFHKIEVKVRGAGLHVRSRDGFFGEAGADQPLDHTREAGIVHALQSPFNAGSIHPRLTALFSNTRQSGSFIDALLYFNPNELYWSNGSDGNHRASIDVAAAAFDENGLALAPVDTTFALQLSAQNYSERLKKGIVYHIRVPVKKPGPYVLRAAVRDAETEASGSADQYVEVPDVASGHLALSGIVLQESGSGAVQANAALTGEAAPAEDATGGAARRSFRRGALLSWNCEIINARSGAGQHADLEVQARMFHDGAQAPVDNAVRASTGSSSDPGRAKAEGAVSVGRDMAPGEYVLQVIVTDKLAGGKFKTATQSMDFEIEP